MACESILWAIIYGGFAGLLLAILIPSTLAAYWIWDEQRRDE